MARLGYSSAIRNINKKVFRIERNKIKIVIRIFLFSILLFSTILFSKIRC